MRNTENKRTTEWRFDLKSFIIFIIIFLTEVAIALFVDDSIVRPYGGDVLVVMMMYYFLKSFVKTRTIYLVAGVVIFAYLIEIGQYLRLVEVLGLENNTVMRIVIGSSFSWGDILAYTIGGAICYLIDRNQSD